MKSAFCTRSSAPTTLCSSCNGTANTYKLPSLLRMNSPRDESASITFAARVLPRMLAGRFSDTAIISPRGSTTTSPRNLSLSVNRSTVLCRASDEPAEYAGSIDSLRLSARRRVRYSKSPESVAFSSRTCINVNPKLTPLKTITTPTIIQRMCFMDTVC